MTAPLCGQYGQYWPANGRLSQLDCSTASQTAQPSKDNTKSTGERLQ